MRTADAEVTNQIFRAKTFRRIVWVTAHLGYTVPYAGNTDLLDYVAVYFIGQSDAGRQPKGIDAAYENPEVRPRALAGEKEP